MTFESIGVISPILKALEKKGYKNPTPIQAQSIPILLEKHDLLGCAQTGTGKTAAFAIPIIQHLHLNKERSDYRRRIRALIVTPTRELAIQIDDNFKEYGEYTGLKNTVIFGGVKQGKQTAALNRGIDILVATPGRLLDLIGQGFITLRDIQFFVLDEADHMLDMGFVHDIKKIIALLPTKRQSLFFSATMPPKILNLSSNILGKYKKVTIQPEQATAEKVGQAVYFVSKKNKTKLLVHVLKKETFDTALVFSRTKHGANKIVKMLDKDGIHAEAIHGNKSQTARQKALENFKNGTTKVLIATDIAARGIDVSQLSLVINFDLPNISETYIHRIGRTGRAKASGIAISFCDGEERPFLKDIEKLISQEIPVIEEHPYPDDGAFTPTKKTSRPPRNNSSRPRSNDRSSSRNNNSTNKPKPRRKFGNRRDD